MVIGEKRKKITKCYNASAAVQNAQLEFRN